MKLEEKILRAVEQTHQHLIGYPVNFDPKFLFTKLYAVKLAPLIPHI